MKKHTLRFREVDRNIFSQAVNGEKTIETRAATKKYRNIKKGDILVIVCGKDRLEKVVKKVVVFKSIKSLLEHYKIKDIMPDLSTAEEAQDRYYSFPGYKEKIKKHGIIAFEI